MVGPEDVPGTLISLTFSWAKIRNLPGSAVGIARHSGPSIETLSPAALAGRAID
jgi:hypothetical protein